MRPQQIGGIALILLGVLLYVMFGVAKGSILDEGPYALLIVPAGIGAGLLLAGGEDASA